MLLKFLKGTKGLIHDNVFYNVDLSLSFLHDYEIDVKLDEDSNSLICDEKLVVLV
jgi:hypothetical protein